MRDHQGLHRLPRHQLPGKTTAAGLGTGVAGGQVGHVRGAHDGHDYQRAVELPELRQLAGRVAHQQLGAGYPIINYEYAIVKKTQPSAAEATAVKNFLSWVLTSGNSSTYLSTVHFLPLPASAKSSSDDPGQLDQRLS